MGKLAAPARQGALGEVPIGPSETHGMSRQVCSVILSLLPQPKQESSMPDQLFGHDGGARRRLRRRAIQDVLHLGYAADKALV
jgi:hypothetical protein